MLLDLMLPDITGDRICEQIKANPATQSTPVIMVTTRGRPEDVERCRQAGCDDFTTKPLNHNELLGKVAAFLNLPNRGSRRMLVQIEVNLGSGDETFFGSSLNLSTTGMLIETSNRMNEGDVVRLDFLLPGKKPIRVPGRVVRIEKAPFGKFRYGVEFITLPEEQRQRIDEWLGSPA